MATVTELAKLEGQALANAALYPEVKRLQAQVRMLTGIVGQFLGVLRWKEVIDITDLYNSTYLAEELMQGDRVSLEPHDMGRTMADHAEYFIEFMDPILDRMVAADDAREAAGK